MSASLEASSAKTAPAEGSGGAARRSASVWTLLFVIFVNLLGFGVVVPLLPFYARSFHASPWQIALLFSAYSIGAFIGEPYWGRLSDRIGRKPVLLCTVGANCLCYGALAWAPDITTAFLIRLVGGAAAGNGSVILAYIADVSAPAERAGRMALLGAAFNLGTVVGPSLGGLLADPGAGPAGFRPPLLAASGLALVSACLVAGLLVESRPRSDVPRSAQPGRWQMLGTAIRHPVAAKLLLLTLLAGIAFTGIESTFGFWGAARFGWGPRQVGFVFFFVGIVAALAQAGLTGRLSRRYGATAMLAGGMALAVCAAALQPLSPGFAVTTGLFVLQAFGVSIAFPNVSALLSRTSDPDHQGQMMGLNTAAAALARVIGPLAGQLAFASLAPDAPFLLGAAILLPAILLPLAAKRARTAARPA